MQAPTKDQLKERAKHLCEIMLEKYSVKVKHGHSLEIISKLFGVKDWNTASALSARAADDNPEDAKAPARTSADKPIVARFQTTGELREFLSNFDDNTKLKVNEYSWADPNTNNPLAGNVTSACSLTFDSEIQRESELILELNTETESTETHIGGSRSTTQSFEQTTAGRAQRRIKYLEHFNFGNWNPKSKVWPARKS